jgi:hypothetical protein
MAVCTALALPARADDTSGTLVVNVTSSSGTADPDPDLMLLFPDGVGYRDAFAVGGSHTFTDITPGNYVLRLDHGTDRVEQFYHQKLTLQDADQITVTAGQTTTINETMLAGGVIEAKLTDSSTGAPANNVCATLNNDSSTQICGLTDGIAQFTDLGQATDDSIQITPSDGLHMPYEIKNIAVQIGQTTSVSAQLTPAAAVTATVLDRATRQPVNFACVSIVASQLPVFGSDCGVEEPTSAYSGEENWDGTVRFGEIAKGDYALFVNPMDSAYGIQWVGAKGGTGSQYNALQIHANPGTVTSIGTVLLDPPGSLSGTVHAGDAKTPPPQYRTGASTFPMDGATVGADGSFTISGLGPYAWPVLIKDASGAYAAQWAGGADRESARLYQVQAGQTSAGPSVILHKSGQIHGQILDQNAQPLLGNSVVKLFNARTGDPEGIDTYAPSGAYAITGLPTGDIKIQIWAEGRGWIWYRKAGSFQTATIVHVTGGRDIALNVTAAPPGGQ